MEEVIRTICGVLGIQPTTVIKKARGSCQEYTIYIILDRMLRYRGEFSKDQCFSDMNPSTSTIMLRNAFGKLSLKGSANWRTYLLNLVNMGICNTCGTIFSIGSVNSTKCANCIKEYNAEYYQGHKAEAKLRQIQREYLLSMYNPSYSEMVEMEEFYNKCPEGYEVDHIVPIKHPLVCGLHSITNLQYLTILDNRSKSNKFEVL